MSQQIGPYLVERRLGMGGMGIVYAARDEALDRWVALKVISPQLADDAGFRARFVREARAMASLDSPHVVSVYAHGESDGQLWMATQLFPDGDLGTLLRRNGPPPLAEGLELMAQVADGLAAAHAVGLVHRDVKPANVLLRRDGARWRAAVADFGIARAGDDQGGLTQGGMIGTPSYMAPELHRGAEATAASDVYSLGCLVWTTLTGTTPFGGSTDYEVVTAHIEAPPPRLGGADPAQQAVDRVLQRALAKDPAQRHPSAAAVRDDLRAAARAASGPDGARLTVVRPAAGVQSATPTPTPTPEPDRSGAAPVDGASRRGPTAPMWAAAAAVAVVAVLALGWALGIGRGADVASPTAATPRSVTPSTAPTSPTEAPTSPTEAPTEDPTAATIAPPEGYSRAVARLATRNFAAELEKDPSLASQDADCVARGVLSGDGLRTMAEAGFFDPSDWTYVDQDLGPYPEIKVMLSAATLDCILN